MAGRGLVCGPFPFDTTSMASDSRSVLVAFAGLVSGGLFLTLALLDGQQLPALGALGMLIFCGNEFVRRADFDALS